MPDMSNPLEILKILNKSNCRECGMPTCMAFALAVSKGQKHLGECPRLPPGTAPEASGPAPPAQGRGENLDGVVGELKRKIRETDLAKAAQRLGARYERGRLTVKMLGKDVSVDQEGNLYSQIHLHPWVAAPFLSYVLYGKGLPLSGNWISMRELPGGGPRLALFGQSEKALKKTADAWPEFFDDMVQLYSGRRAESHFNADICLVLDPLPLVPVLIAYWKPEDGIGSELHMFFDQTAGDNIGMDPLYALAAGLARMFEKIAARHAGG
jgi:hypothetical protein